MWVCVCLYECDASENLFIDLCPMHTHTKNGRTEKTSLPYCSFLNIKFSSLNDVCLSMCSCIRKSSKNFITLKSWLSVEGQLSAFETWVYRGAYPKWRSFWGILGRIYTSFGENHGKLRTARSISATGVWTWHLPSSSFELYRWATGGALKRRNWYLPNFSLELSE